MIKNKTMKRQIVRRTYSIDNGKPSTMIYYAVAPPDASGMECFDVDIDKACLFREGESWFRNETISGNSIYGDFSYKQEVINVKIEIES